MTLTFAFKYQDRIYCAIDRLVWFENNYILQDKYLISEDNKRLFVSSGTVRAALEIDSYFNDCLPNYYLSEFWKGELEEDDPQKEEVLERLIGNQRRLKCRADFERLEKIAEDGNYNGLIVGHDKICLIDQKLTLFDMGNFYAIGVENKAARALLDVMLFYRNLVPREICLQIFTILSKINIFIASPSKETINIFRVDEKGIEKINF